MEAGIHASDVYVGDLSETRRGKIVLRTLASPKMTIGLERAVLMQWLWIFWLIIGKKLEMVLAVTLDGDSFQPSMFYYSLSLRKT